VREGGKRRARRTTEYSALKKGHRETVYVDRQKEGEEQRRMNRLTR